MAETNVPDRSAKLELGDLRALGKDQTEKLTAYLSNSSFLVRVVRGRIYVHFAKGGVAYFWDTRGDKMERGEWSVSSAPFGKDFVCWTKGHFSNPMTTMEKVDNCRRLSEYIAIADYLSRGDIFDLKSGRAPE